MLFGLLPPYRSGVTADPVWMTRFVRHAEACGFESVYTVEHVVVPGRYDEAYPYSDSGRMPLAVDCPIPDPLDLLAFLAARTERIRLGTGVMVVPHHHPLILAKRLATIDVLSGGRMLLGAGVGWMREELESTGVDFSRRGARLDETLEAMRALWALPPYEKGAGAPGASFHGEFFDFDDVWSEPRPVRPGGVPIHIGGHSEAAARRCGRLGDGFHPLGLDDDELVQRWELARRTAEEHGRDPEALELSVTVGLGSVDPAAVERFAALGVHRIVCSTAVADLDRLTDELAAVAAAVGMSGS
jgi:probable F420-dependent oxidoreductase